MAEPASIKTASAKGRKELLDMRVAHAPTVRTFSDWTPQRLRSAEVMAEQGHLYWAVTLCEWLLTDDRVAGALSARIEALMGLEPTFELGAGRRAKRAAKALEAGEDWWEAFPESQLSLFVKWGILLGCAPGRHCWIERADHGGRVLPNPTFWHPQTLRFDTWTRRWMIQEFGGSEVEVTPGDGEWIMHAPSGIERAWAHGLWRYLSRWALIKSFAQQDWARHSERGAQKVITAPERATKEQRQEIAADVQAMGADSVIALPNGFDMKLLEITATTAEIYKAQVDMANEAFAVAIRGGNLSTIVKGGSKAATETQVKTNDQAKLRFDAKGLELTLHNQSLSPWAQFNFGDPRLAPWPSYPVKPEEDKDAKAGLMSKVATGVKELEEVGFDVDRNAVKEEFGLSFVQAGDRSADPKPNGPRKRQDEPDPDATAKALAGGVPMLASGARAQDNQGFVDGQEFVDRVVSEGVAAASAVLSNTFLEDLLNAIDAAETYDEVREAVLRHYSESQSPTELRETLRKAFLLADFAGLRSVDEDEP